MAETLGRLRVLVLAVVAVLPMATTSAAGAMASTTAAVSAQPRPPSDGGGPFVIGGERASIADYPWVVYLMWANGLQFCGGALVAANKVVTAAHCTRGLHPNQVRVVAGREDKYSNDGVVADVTDVWVHPMFASVTTGNDVAVLTLDQNLDFAPLDLVDGTDAEEYTAGNNATILGWGRTSEGGPTSRYLLKASLPITSDETCSTVFAEYNRDAMICAATDDGAVDTCQGDSGGPLTVGGKLAGVTSWGSGCAHAGKPGVYTRVGTYHDLIEPEITS